MTKTSLDDIAQQIEAQSQPPVHLWQPEHVGEIDIVIDANGFWFHEGERIMRDPLVRLFASILWAEDKEHYLVTPVEKLKIQVEDAPYVINQAEKVDSAWVVTTNTHEQVIVGEKHPIELRKYQGQALPYVRIRYDLWARINRSVYFQWVSEALEYGEEHNKPKSVSLNSGNYRFTLSE